MDFFKGLTGAGSIPADPPASVLAEWNKYSTGDLESQGPVHQPGRKDTSVFAGVQQTFLNATNAASSSIYGAQSSASSSISLRIPSGTQFVYFAALIGGALLFFTLAIFIFLPMLIISPSKFALCFTFGSVCTMAAMVMLSGWQAGLQHLLSAEKLPFSTVYAGSMMATIYAAVIMHSYILSLVFSITQVFALLYYIMSYFPGGALGMQLALSMAGRAMLSCFGSATRSTTG